MKFKQPKGLSNVTQVKMRSGTLGYLGLESEFMKFIHLFWWKNALNGPHISNDMNIPNVTKMVCFVDFLHHSLLPLVYLFFLSHTYCGIMFYQAVNQTHTDQNTVLIAADKYYL